MKISRISLAGQLAESGDRSHTIDVIQSLLWLMRKFGKSLNSIEIISFLEIDFPEALRLYDVLGRSSCTINQCQQLLISVSRLMDYNHLDITTNLDDLDLSLLEQDTLTHVSTSAFGLSVIGKGKIYKRTLDTDLLKMTI